jgi:hypothetical protein
MLEAKPKIKRRRRLWLIAIVIFAIAWLLCGLLFSFDINLPGELQSARTRWEAQNIDDYHYTAIFGSYSAIVKVVITVLDGRVALIEQYENPMMPFPNVPATPFPISEAPEWYVEYFNDSLPVDLSYYTMDELFTFVEQNFDQQSRPILEMCSTNGSDTRWRTGVMYEDNLGHIEAIGFTDCGMREWGLGLACVSLSHCWAGVHFSDFEIIEPER